jgi:T5SS/PEP-CTERM-associated repeat protein/autotransporter-associated beta strand protein
MLPGRKSLPAAFSGDGEMRLHLLATAAAAALLAATSSARAQSNWTGVVSSDWFNANNWVPAIIPRQTDDVNINTVTPHSTAVASPGALVRNLSVGPNGTGMLTIQTGGTLANSLGTVGNLPGGLGTVTVTDAGSNWSNAGSVVVGGQGTGTLTIQNGGTVNSGGGSVGLSVGSTGTVTVTGPGSSWINGLSGGLNIGSFGTGTLTILNGGNVINITNFAANIGNAAGSQGTVTVTGPGSTWSNSSGVNIGNLGTGTLTIADSGIVAGPVTIATNAGSIGTLNIGAGAGDPAAAPGTLTAPSVAFGAGTGTLNFNHTSTNYTFAPAISGNGSVNVFAGITILTANNTYTGPTTINGGGLVVNGSIAPSSMTTVNSGAALLGSGTVGSTVVNTGGFLVPGPVGTPGTMTVTGSLAFQSGALYVVQVNPTTASITNVSGPASLAGTVGAIFAPGTYGLVRSYTILTSGARVGTFDALTTSGLPADFQAFLSHPGNTAVINLFAQLVPEPTPPTPPGGAIPPVPGLPPLPPQSSAPTPPFTVNEINVGHAIDNFFNNGGALPPAFLSLFGLTGSNLTNALDQLSGEVATGAQKVGFQLTDQFLNLMLDPFVEGRGCTEYPVRAIVKGPPPMPVCQGRWATWVGAYGGGNHTAGDLAVIGSHDLSARTVGVAAGLDYHLTPDTVLGFALAGGGTNWNLSQGLGSGKSDAFQAGIYGTTRWGPAYLAGAFAFTNHWMSTDRTAVGDHLTADFNAQSYGGRLEGGYRFATLYGAFAPYAAIQAQSFHTPGYAETDAIANGFALVFPSRDAHDTRSELGARYDKQVLLNYGAVLVWRARLAWAHDWISDPNLMPTFEALPGASFIVNGATPVKNSALASAGTELRLINGVSLLAKFDGEFANRAQTYAGTGTVRYVW